MTHLITIDIIKKAINEATRILPIVWPLRASIAINPLWDLREMPFDQALNYVRNYLPVRGCLCHDEYLKLFRHGKISKLALKKALREHKVLSDEDAEQSIQKLFELNSQQENDSYIIENGSLLPLPKCIINDILDFISRYFDKNHVNKSTKSPNYTLWQTWKQEKISQNLKLSDLLNSLPFEPLQALQHLLRKMEVKQEELTKYFTVVFSQLIGWHGLIKWLESRQNNPLINVNASLVEMALIWSCSIYTAKINIIKPLSYSYAPLLHNKFSHNEILLIWQRAFELTYQDSLLEKLKINLPRKNEVMAQFIFCIDVRSEALRRQLESVNSYKTYGYAGFFGSIFSLEDDLTQNHSLQAPALVEPRFTAVKKTPLSLYAQLMGLLNKMTDQAKNKNYSTFAFFEIIGSWIMLSLMLKTFFSKFSALTHAPKSSYSHPFLTPECIDDTIKNMSSFLKTIGLTHQFSSVVIVCGHQALTTNNPFHATFECGACGGNSGFINAKITCEILNNRKIRHLLLNEGIAIPNETTFIPACHETTTDKLWLEPDVKYQCKLLKRIESDIEQALIKLKKEKEASLPGHNHYQDRAFHYAELVPEWGLANNAAMIIGPRTLTENVNLHSRVFLHSYEPEIDHDASILEGILNAPMIVAHWINAQYYFSATDPEIYGAGNKALHNIVSSLGVMEGNQSDLKIGLPLQSVFFQHDRVHIPLKLLVIIYADHFQIDLIFKRNPNLKSLFENKWLNLQVIKPRKNIYATR